MQSVGILPLLASSPAAEGAEFQVNLTTVGAQSRPAVATDASGNFLIVWDSTRGATGLPLDVVARRFDPDGFPVGDEFVVNTSDLGSEMQGSMSRASADMNSGGAFVISWESSYFSYYWGFDIHDILIRRYDDAGIPQGDDFAIAPAGTFPPDRHAPAVGVRPDADFVLVWSDGGGAAIARATYFDANGTPLSEGIGLAPVNAPFKDADVATQDTHGFVTAFGSFGDGSFGTVLGRRLDAQGQVIGGPFQVNTFAQGYQTQPAVAGSDTGGFVVVWQSEGQDGDKEGIFGQLFDRLGQPLFDEFRVNTYTIGRQSFPDVAVDRTGNFMVVWQSEGQDGSGLGIFAQFFDVAGNPLGGEFRVNTTTSGSQLAPSIAPAGPSGFILTWQGPDGSGTGIFADRFLPCSGLPDTVANLSVETDGSGSALLFTWEDMPGSEHFILFGSDDPNGIFEPLGRASRGTGGSCGNDICEPFLGEDCLSCPTDCNGETTGSPASRFCCGDLSPGTVYGVSCDDPRCSDQRVQCRPTVSLSLPTPAGDAFYLMAGSNACGTGPIR